MPALMILLAALAMSVGWGFRGNYGHEAGAMVPGALLGLAISLTSRRPDWQSRGVTLAFLGALGWAFGGQMSYAKIIGYTCHTSFKDVYYGYNCLFLIGGMWGGMGAGILALALTESTETLDQWCTPLIILWAVWQLADLTGLTAKLEANAWLHDRARAWWLKDADWIAALSALLAAGLTALLVPRSRSQAACIAWLAGGWLIAFFLLVGVCHLHMTPPRGDNWAGCVGLFLAFCAYLVWQKNRAALYLLVWGFFAGGFGFAIADLPQVLGRASWGTIGQWAVRYQLDYWKWMEQGFGLFMGAVVAVGVLRLARGRLAPPAELSSRKFDFMSLVYLLVIMMWENLHKNLKNWNKAQLLPKTLLGIENRWWFITVGLLLSAVVIVALYRQGLGRIQLTPPGVLGRIRWLFLLILWIALAGDFGQAFPSMKNSGPLFVEMTFWLTAGICSLIVVALPEGFAFVEDPRPPTDAHWKTRWVLLVGFALAPAVLYGLTWCSVHTHSVPLVGSHLRFGTPEEINEP
ncbi:MAG TPA: hypothetical protein VGP68_07565 [Gemmataceae bacterium]|nr:hypothetical protein [Gemmataceae bacterium]